MSNNAAMNDLRDKLRFERMLMADLSNYFDKVVSAFDLFARNRVHFNIEIFQEDLEKILLEHYKRVEKKFAFRLRNVLPREIQSTVGEDEVIKRALNFFNGVRAKLQAAQINKTTVKNIQQSMELARTFDTDESELVDGVIVNKKELVTGFELILTAKQILKRKLKGRLGGIISTETQAPAEVSKLTETEVLSGDLPTLLGGGQKETKVTKIWVSLGDDLVRFTHLEADGQERKAKEPFVVGGFKLMVPGDSSFGAPAQETINCRCAAVYDEKKVVAIRWDMLAEESFISVGQI